MLDAGARIFCLHPGCYKARYRLEFESRSLIKTSTYADILKLELVKILMIKDVSGRPYGRVVISDEMCAAKTMIRY